MLARVRSRGLFRVLALGELVACPLGAVAEPYAYQRQFYDGSRGSHIDDAMQVAKRRNAEPVPFDLTYLPPRPEHTDGPSGIVAIRPCALFDRPGGHRLAKTLLLDNGLLDYVKGFIGLRGMTFPAPHELDMVLCRIQMEIKIKPTDDGKHGSFNARSNTFVLRTRDRFDWERALGRMNQGVLTKEHRGFLYDIATVDTKNYLPGYTGEPLQAALFVADARTLVIDTEDNVKALLDRIADKKQAEQPHGWEKVNRGVLAVAVSNANKAWARFLPGAEGPRLEKGGDWEWNILDDLDELLIGLDDRPTTRFYLRATASEPFAGKRLVWNAKRLLALAEAHLGVATHSEADFVRALWKKGRITPSFRGFEITSDAGTDLIGPILDHHTPPAREPRPMLQTLRGGF